MNLIRVANTIRGLLMDGILIGMAGGRIGSIHRDEGTVRLHHRQCLRKGKITAWIPSI